jgi:hypothetical protein
MPIYHRTYGPGELQFITTGTYPRNRRFHPFNVYTEEKRLEKLNYMHSNPAKRGLVNCPGDWPWSSWRYYFLQDASVLRMDRLD